VAPTACRGPGRPLWLWPNPVAPAAFRGPGRLAWPRPPSVARPPPV